MKKKLIKGLFRALQEFSSLFVQIFWPQSLDVFHEWPALNFICFVFKISVLVLFASKHVRQSSIETTSKNIHVYMEDLLSAIFVRNPSITFICSVTTSIDISTNIRIARFVISSLDWRAHWRDTWSLFMVFCYLIIVTSVAKNINHTRIYAATWKFTTEWRMCVSFAVRNSIREEVRKPMRETYMNDPMKTW